MANFCSQIDIDADLQTYIKKGSVMAIQNELGSLRINLILSGGYKLRLDFSNKLAKQAFFKELIGDSATATLQD